MRAHILNHRYLDTKGVDVTIGGVQTYITNLSEVLREAGFSVSVYQLADVAFEREYNGITVYGIPFSGKGQYDQGKLLLKHAKPYINKDTDMVIFGIDNLTVDTDGVYSIALQHGISWDTPATVSVGKLKYVANFLKKALLCWKILKRVNRADQVVCVDYNFLNWYRASSSYPGTKMKVIPNFTDIPGRYADKHGEEAVNVIFARRFQRFRGTRVFAEALERVLEKHPEINVTVAGDGPDENWLKDRLGRYSQVSFIKYASTESLKIHADKHIAVIPTLGSEGTSLSLLEAMASQCAVICTNIGGMTNIVMDSYNGLMIEPDADSVYEAMIRLIEDPALRKALSEKAYETAVGSFSFDIWKSKWHGVLAPIADKLSEKEAK